MQQFHMLQAHALVQSPDDKAQDSPHSVVSIAPNHVVLTSYEKM